MSVRQISILFVIGVLTAFLLTREKGPPPMVKPAAKKPYALSIHGHDRVDNYFWMRERDTAEVLDYLKAENRRTREAMAPVADLEHALYQEIRSRIKENDASVPVLDSGYLYYVRYQTGQEYPLHARRRGTMEAPEQIILDENDVARGKEYCEVGDLQVSSDQRLLAYAVDTHGRRIYDIHFRDLATGHTLKDSIKAVTADFVWAEDNKTLFYVRQDPETLRAYQVYRHEVGSGRPAELVYEEPDTTYNVAVDGSKTHKFLFIKIEKRDSTEYRYLDARDPGGKWQTFLPRSLNHEYFLGDGGDRFYILTNWKAKNFRVMQAPYETHAREKWTEVIAHDPGVLIEGIDVNEKFLVLSERSKGLTQLRVWSREDSKLSRLLHFDEPAYEVALRPLPEYGGTTIRFEYESLVQPSTIYDENFLTGQRTLRKRQEVRGYNQNLYETRRIWAMAPDKTLVPITIVKRKDVQLNGRNPMLLYGYGSYGLSLDLYFRSSVVSLLDRGFVYAIAHIRGGSELGRDWYEHGRLKHKMNTFTDFIASTETLIKEGYTSPEHLHIKGESAGGLLMGAVINMRPDLFKSAVAGVPFVDVLTTMLDEDLPLTTGEYNEWGDPRIRTDFEYMRQYSPYDNVERKAYPHLLVTTGYHDSQVQYWEPAKWVAKLRELKTDDHLLLLYTELEAGHGGASGRFEALKILAKEYAFILMLEGIGR